MVTPVWKYRKRAHVEGREQPLGCHLMPGRGRRLAPFTVPPHPPPPSPLTNNSGILEPPSSPALWYSQDNSAAGFNSSCSRVTGTKNSVWVTESGFYTQRRWANWEPWLFKIPGPWSHPKPQSLLNPCSPLGCTSHCSKIRTRQARVTMARVYLRFSSLPAKYLRFQSHPTNFK